MIDRYTLKDMGNIWTDENRLKTWLEVELAAMKALEEVGRIPLTVSGRKLLSRQRGCWKSRSRLIMTSSPSRR
jgi:adenylosuccinate lyase